MKHRSDVEAWSAVVACLPDDPDGDLSEDEKPKAKLLSLLAGTHQYSGNVRLARTCAAATGHAILDGRARVARLTEALRWARRYATGFDHEHDCPRRTDAQRAVESCTCGYASLGEPIDAILEQP